MRSESHLLGINRLENYGSVNPVVLKRYINRDTVEHKTHFCLVNTDSVSFINTIGLFVI